MASSHFDEDMVELHAHTLTIHTGNTLVHTLTDVVCVWECSLSWPFIAQTEHLT